MGRLPVAALCALLLLAAFAGCGDAGGDEPPSKRERQQAAYEEERAAYIEETDGFCRRMSRRIHDELAPYERRVGNPPDPEASAKLVEVMAPREEFAMRRVRSIVLPNRDVEAVLHFLDVWRDEVDRAKRDPVAFVEAEPPFPEAERLARQFGFEDCGKL